MFEELKKKILKTSLFWSIILIIAGLGLAGWNAPDAFYAATGYVDLNTLAPNDLKGQLVDIELTENFGCYLEETSYNTKTHVTKTTDLYYIILLASDENPDNWQFMTIKVPVRYQSQMDSMTENTYNELLSDPVSFSGKLKKLDEEEYGYFKEFFTEIGMTEAEFAESTIPYYFNAFASKTSMNIMYIALFSIGAVLLIFGIFRIAKVVGGGSLKKLRKDIAASGYSESMVESDYRNAKSFDRGGTLKVGRLMTYYINGSDARAIPNSKIMWAYQNTVTHRTNGVKTGTTYNVMIYDEFTPKGHEFTVANESIAQDMLSLINTMLPWVVVGYSDELKKLYNKDRSQFLQLRYNTCEHTAAETDSGDSATCGQP